MLYGSQMQLRPHYDRPDSLVSEYVGAVVVATDESYPHWGCDLESMYPTTLYSYADPKYNVAYISRVSNENTMEQQLIPFDDA